jgi:hypothetical protein
VDAPRGGITGVASDFRETCRWNKAALNFSVREEKRRASFLRNLYTAQK